MWIIISTLHILASLLLIVLVLLQQGKGADAGAAFGGDSSSVFGPMVENPLKNLTTIVAIVFMSTSVSLAYKARLGSDGEGQLFSRETKPTVESAATENVATPPTAAANTTTEAAKTEDKK